VIYHITSEHLWRAQSNDACFVPPDFAREGFVHCCTADQVEGVLKRYFAGAPSLLMLHINESRLDYPVRYEGTPEAFPHIYGKINMTAVEKITGVP
jgi:uncharacterized protein (DUF952 family)